MLVGDKAVDGTPISQLTPGSEKMVRLRCDGCGKETTTVWHNYVQYQRKRGWTGETSCQRCAVRETTEKNRGRPAPHVAKRNRSQRGEKHPSWRGGRYVDAHGYVMVNVKSGRNKTSGWYNYRKEHVVLIEEQVGRKLIRGDVVHHIDGRKANNDLSNLWLTNHSGHRNAHASLQEIGYRLVCTGLIKFDRDSGTYIPTTQLLEMTDDDGKG